MTEATAPVITFNAEDHTYTLDGKPVPGVSEILEPMYDFRFVDPAALERSRDFGKKVHKTVELFEAGDLKRDTLHVTLNNHLTQWERFKEDFLFLPIAHEILVASRKYSYCGTFDCHGLLLPQNPGDVEEHLLLDVKTGEEYDAHKLQTAGYKTAAVEQGILPVSTKRASLYLYEDGYDVRWHNNKLDEVAFLSLATIKYWRKHHGKGK